MRFWGRVNLHEAPAADTRGSVSWCPKCVAPTPARVGIVEPGTAAQSRSARRWCAIRRSEGNGSAAREPGAWERLRRATGGLDMPRLRTRRARPRIVRSTPRARSISPRANAGTSAKGQEATWRLGPFVSQRLRDLARAFDEELRHRARFAVFQSDDADRRTGDRQFDRQFLDEWMPTGKLQPELRNDREIAAGPQQIGANFERGGRRRWRADNQARRRERPRSRTIRMHRPAPAAPTVHPSIRQARCGAA